jgi:hypothetical protein
VAANSGACQGKITIKELTWGNNVKDLKPPFDIIVGTSCPLYQIEAVQPLIDTLKDLSNNKTGIDSHLRRPRNEGVNLCFSLPSFS